MKTHSAHTPASLFAVAARGLHLPSAWNALATRVLAMALLALVSAVAFFAAIGVVAFALELSRAVALAGHVGMAAIGLTALTGLLLRRTRLSRI